MKKSLILLSLALLSEGAVADYFTINTSVPIEVELHGNTISSETVRGAPDAGNFTQFNNNPTFDTFVLKYNNNTLAELPTSKKYHVKAGCNGSIKWDDKTYNVFWTSACHPVIYPDKLQNIPHVQPSDQFENKSSLDVTVFSVPINALGKVIWSKGGCFDTSVDVCAVSQYSSDKKDAVLKSLNTNPAPYHSLTLPYDSIAADAFWVVAYKTNPKSGIQSNSKYNIAGIIRTSHNGNWALPGCNWVLQQQNGAFSLIDSNQSKNCNLEYFDYPQKLQIKVVSKVGLPLKVGDRAAITGSPDFAMTLDSEDAFGYEQSLIFNGQKVATFDVPVGTSTVNKPVTACTFTIDYDYTSSTYQITSDQSQCTVTDKNLSVLPPPNSDAFTNSTPVKLTMQPVLLTKLGSIAAAGNGVNLTYTGTTDKILAATKDLTVATPGFDPINKQPEHAFWVFKYRSSPTEYKIAGVLQTSYDADWLKTCGASINYNSNEQYEFTVENSTDANCLWVDTQLTSVPTLSCNDVTTINNKAVGSTEYYDSTNKKFYQFRDSLMGSPYTIPNIIGALETAAPWGSVYFKSCEQVKNYPAAVKVTTCTAGKPQRETGETKRDECKGMRRQYSCSCDPGSAKSYYMLLQP